MNIFIKEWVNELNDDKLMKVHKSRYYMNLSSFNLADLELNEYIKKEIRRRKLNKLKKV